MLFRFPFPLTAKMLKISLCIYLLFILFLRTVYSCGHLIGLFVLFVFVFPALYIVFILVL
jgi:hypothetical protein